LSRTKRIRSQTQRASNSTALTSCREASPTHGPQPSKTLSRDRLDFNKRCSASSATRGMLSGRPVKRRDAPPDEKCCKIKRANAPAGTEPPHTV
jgi:hypothetical protein